MRCVNCGNVIPEGAEFCPRCGERVKKSASSAKQIGDAILYKSTRLRDYYISIKEVRVKYDDAVALGEKFSESCHLPSLSEIKSIIEEIPDEKRDHLNRQITDMGGDPLAKSGEERFYWLKGSASSSGEAPYYSAMTGNSGMHSKESLLSARPVFFENKGGSSLKLNEI